MNNKQLINGLKSNAELAMASYGYFHLATKDSIFIKIHNNKVKNNKRIL